MSNNRLEVPYNIRMQQTKDRLRAKKAQMEKKVHVRSKEANAKEDDKTQGLPQNEKVDNEKSNVNIKTSVKKLSSKSRDDTMLKKDKKARLQQMVVMSEILSKPVSMRKRHDKRGIVKKIL